MYIMCMHRVLENCKEPTRNKITKIDGVRHPTFVQTKRPITEEAVQLLEARQEGTNAGTYKRREMPVIQDKFNTRVVGNNTHDEATARNRNTLGSVPVGLN